MFLVHSVTMVRLHPLTVRLFADNPVVPEVMELLSGLSWADQTDSLSSRPLNLDQIITQVTCQQPAQPYIDIDFTVRLHLLI